MDTKTAMGLPGTMLLVSDLADDDLFQLLEAVSDELSARVATRKLLSRIDAERLGLFPAGLISRLVEQGEVLGIEGARQALGLTTRNGVYSAMLRGLKSLKVGSPGTGTGAVYFLPAWLEAYRANTHKGGGRPRQTP
jgi:hypothetical protein